MPFLYLEGLQLGMNRDRKLRLARENAARSGATSLSSHGVG